jgi:putative CocE/NonD family hydrolase
MSGLGTLTPGEVLCDGDVVVLRNVMMPARDGARLSTDLFLPARDSVPVGEALPALLARTPYGKRHPREQYDAIYFARNGYVAAVQDCRGRFASDGTFRPFRNEAEDGFDAVQWLADLELCDGSVGTHGCSYGAWVQLQLATQAPPALRTMIPHTGPNNAYSFSMHVGGTRTLGLLRWHIYMLLDSHEARENPAIAAAADAMLTPEGFLRWAEQIPWRRGQTALALAPSYEDSAFELYFDNNDYSEFWREPDLAIDEWFDRFPRIPMLWITGWYEVYARSIVDGYEAMVRRDAPNQHLLAGPWTHNNFEPFNGDANYGFEAGRIPPNATEALAYKLAWFDRWLKDDETVELGAPVKLFLMGGGDGRRDDAGRLNHGGRWIAGESFRQPDSRALKLYLREGGALTREAPPDDASNTTYTYDPRNTVHSDGRCEIAYGPAAGKSFYGMGPYDQIQIETLPGHGAPGMPTASRRDLLAFQTPPLPDAVEVAGTLKAALFVSSDAPDTDFYVKLVDVYPPTSDHPAGYAFPVTDGILRARYREDFSVPSLMEEGEVYELTIPLQPVANLFAAGHRIRVDISSSSFPSYDINPNTGDPSGRTWRPANNTIHHDGVHASHIEVTVR